MATPSSSIPEIRIDPSPPMEPSPEVHGDMSSKGTPTDKTLQDDVMLSEGADGGGNLEGPMTFLADILRLAVMKENKGFEVTPTVVINKKYRRLFYNVVRGNWKLLVRKFQGDFEELKAELMTVENEPYSVLDIAVMFAPDELVGELVKHLPEEFDVVILRKTLFNAARKGRIRVVRALVDKIHDDSETIEQALLHATQYAPKQGDVISYLAQQIKSTPAYETRKCLIKAGHLGIALSLSEQFDTSTSSKETENLILLGDLVKMKSNFHGGTRLNFWESCISKCIPFCLVDESNDDVRDSNMTQVALKIFKKSLWYLATKSAPRLKSFGELQLRRRRSCHFAIEALFTAACNMNTSEIVESLLTSGIVLDAASRGIFEIVFLCLKHYPELMLEKKFTEKLTKEIVSGRHVDLFRLVNAFKTVPYLIDVTSTRNLMETLVKSQPGYEPTDVSGAAFLMQRELQWFKVLEDRSNPSLNSLEFEVRKDGGPFSKSLILEETKEGRGKTFWEVFVEERQDLLKEAEQWMKNTSSSCSLVATLIITVAFTAIFTVPGGNDSGTGIPIFLKKGSFMVFAIADALALFSSVTATLMFLAILTSSYAIEDFLQSLPRKMILGLTFLFLSLAFMLVAFSSALSIILSEQFKWIYIPIILLAAFPVALFAILQLPLYVGMVKSTYRPRLYRPLKMLNY